MNYSMKVVMFIYTFLAIVWVSGCAMNPNNNYLSENNISIEKNNSMDVHVISAYVVKTDAGIRVYGILKRHKLHKVIVKGYVDVEVIGPDGQSKSLISMKHMNLTRKRIRTSYGIEINDTPETGSVIRVTHREEQSTK